VGRANGPTFLDLKTDAVQVDERSGNISRFTVITSRMAGATRYRAVRGSVWEIGTREKER